MSLADVAYQSDTLSCPHCDQEIVLVLDDFDVYGHEVYWTDCPFCNKNVQFTIRHIVSFAVVEDES